LRYVTDPKELKRQRNSEYYARNKEEILKISTTNKTANMNYSTATPPNIHQPLSITGLDPLK
jgi:hypothetical protein